MNNGELEKYHIIYLMTGDRDDDPCPLVTLSDNLVLFQDSQGNIFRLSLKHWDVLVEKILTGDLSRPQDEATESDTLG